MSVHWQIIALIKRGHSIGNMAEKTLIQCHFVRGLINHRLRFGAADKIIKLDKYRKIACFKPDRTLGYIRWRANEYGTQDWRFYIFRTQSEGIMTSVPGVSPAVKLLASFNGSKTVKGALSAFDEVERKSKGTPEKLSESFWLSFQNDLSARKSLNGITKFATSEEVSHAR